MNCFWILILSRQLMEAKASLKSDLQNNDELCKHGRGAGPTGLDGPEGVNWKYLLETVLRTIWAI